MLIDTHAHLNMDPLYPRWQEVVSDAVTGGVEALIVPGTDLLTSQRAIEMAKFESRIIPSVGIHPESLSEDINQLYALAHQPLTAAIGEIGLDYYRFPNEMDQEKNIKAQRRLFTQQLDLARELGLPVLIHTRTEAAMLDAVTDITAVYGRHEFRGIFHCFTGSFAFYEAIAAWDTYIGVGGMITYSHQHNLQQVVQQIPLERIVLETDAPLLTPQPLPRGVNTPENVTIAACKLAEIKALPLSRILEVTGNNALRLLPQLKQL